MCLKLMPVTLLSKDTKKFFFNAISSWSSIIYDGSVNSIVVANTVANTGSNPDEHPWLGAQDSKIVL